MSRIGIGANLMQPSSQCLSCKRWKSATGPDWAGFRDAGRCTLGYCEKKNFKKHKRK